MKLALGALGAVVVMIASCGGSTDALDGPSGASAGAGAAGAATGGSSGTGGSAGATGGGAGTGAQAGSGGAVPPPDAGDSGSDVTTIDAPPPITAEQACQQYVGAYCTGLNTCAPVYLQLFWVDAPDCEAKLQAACVKALALPDTVKTAAFTDACGQALKALDCTTFLTRDVPVACLPAAGPRAEGAVCGDDGQCATGYCATSTDKSCGVCRVRAPVGGACTRDDDCDFSLKCAKNMVCAAQGALDSTCDDNHPCEPGLSCMGASGSSMGNCTPAGGAGAACDPQEKDKPGCDLAHGYFCHPITKVCQDMELVQAGDPCGVVLSGYALCTQSSFCKLIATTGTCLAPAQEGKACNNTDGPLCVPPAKCENGVCTTPQLAACN